MAEKPPAKGDPDVVEALEQLLIQARRGDDIIGLAYVVLKVGSGYEGDVRGAALQHPVMALGLAKALQHQLLKLIK